jgi:hypothetical protein
MIDPSRWQYLVVLIALGSAQVFGQTTAPAEPGDKPAAPSSQPALPTRAATPKDALKILAAAMRDGDSERLASVVATDNPKQVRMLGAMASLARSLARLNHCAAKAFGEREAARFTDDTAAHFDQMLARIDAADVQVNGNRATIRYPGEDQAPFEMRRMPPERPGQDPQWKVPIAQFTDDADAAALDDRLTELNVQSKIVDDVADELAAGKYKNAEEVKDAWRARIVQTLPSHPPGPSSRPTTRPSGP